MKNRLLKAFLFAQNSLKTRAIGGPMANKSGRWANKAGWLGEQMRLP
jgi:hypothetical protein